MSNLKKVTFNLDEDTYYQIKQLALDKRTTATKFLVKWTVAGLKQELKEIEREKKEQKKLQDY